MIQNALTKARPTNVFNNLLVIIGKNQGAVKMWSVIIMYSLNYLYNMWCSGGGSGGYRLGGPTFRRFIVVLSIAYDGTIATTAHSLGPLSSSSPSFVLFLRPNRLWTSINFSCSIQVIE